MLYLLLFTLCCSLAQASVPVPPPDDILFRVRTIHLLIFILAVGCFLVYRVLKARQAPPKRQLHTIWEGSYEELLEELKRLELDYEEAVHNAECLQASSLFYKCLIFYLQKWSRVDLIWSLKKQLQLKEDRIIYEVKTKYDYAQKITRLRSELIRQKRLVISLTDQLNQRDSEAKSK